MKKVNVLISWSGDNYCVGTGEVNGLVVATHKNLEDAKNEFSEAFAFHIDDTDSIENYTFIFEVQTSALLHQLDGVLSRAALSRATGINVKQLSHYMTGHRNPRPLQRQKIINGIHSIGKQLVEVV